jgi:hypothetical protein
MAIDSEIPARTVRSRFIVNYALGGLFIGAIAGYQFLLPLVSSEPEFGILRGWNLELAGVIWLSVALGGVIGAVAGAIGGAIAGGKADKRTAAAVRAAKKVRGEFLPADADLDQKLSTDFSLPGATMGNVIRTQLQGAQLAVGDLHISRESGTGSDAQTYTVTQSAACYTADGPRFPRFTLQPEQTLLKVLARAIGSEKIEFPSQPHFSKIYNLSAPHPEPVRQLFEGDVLETMVRTPGLHIVSAADALLMYRPGQECEVEELEAFINESARILGRFDKSARGMDQSDAATAFAPDSRRDEMTKQIAAIEKRIGWESRGAMIWFGVFVLLMVALFVAKSEGYLP